MKVVYLSTTPLGKQLGVWLFAQAEAEVVYCDTAGERRSVSALESLHYDLGLSFLYPHKIPAPEVYKPQYGWLNFHPAPLPMMRGRDLAYHAIMEGREYFGASVHYMDEAFDTGPLVQTHTFKIAPEMTAGDLVRESHAILARLFKFWVPYALKGEQLPAQNQADLAWMGKPSYYTKSDLAGDTVWLGQALECHVRALTVAERRLYARALIGGKPYRIVPEDSC